MKKSEINSVRINMLAHSISSPLRHSRATCAVSCFFFLLSVSIGAAEVQLAEAAGPSSTLVRQETVNQAGRATESVSTNLFVELANGLNYFDGKEWLPTDTSLELEPGYAKAWKGQHKVTFAAELNCGGAVAIELPDGERMRSQIYGIAYYNSRTGESVLIAGLQDSQAWLIDSNRILYPNAFQGFSADVRYTYTRDGVEQDVILRESPPPPSEFGWDPTDVRLEVWTEFSTRNQPKPVLVHGTTQHADPEPDELMSFGTMEMAEGRAFTVGEEDVALALVHKRWVQLEDGRSFLVETVGVPAIADALEILPEPTKRSGASIKFPRFKDRLQAFLSTPKSEPRKQQAKIQSIVGSDKLLALNQMPGVVLDYQLTLSTGQTNYTFRGDTTYLVTGTVDLFGTTTLEGGTVVKYTATNSPRLNIQGALSSRTSRYRPAVFTAVDDNSVGEVISGSTGNPGTTAYGTYALRFLNTGVSHKVEHVRVRNASYGIGFGGSLSNTVFNAQFVRCQFPISSTGTGSVGVYNVLVDAGLAGGHVFSGASTTPFVMEHGTLHNTPSLLSSCTLSARNSLLVAITTVQSYTGSGNTQGNFQTGTASGLFQPVLAGNFYLASGSPHRNAGQTSIDSTLRREIREMTSHPPIDLLQSFTGTTTLAPQALRDVDVPDRGYHYAPIDYILSGRTLTSGTLALTNGVAVAAYGASGLILGNSAVFISDGQAERLNRLLRYQNVQEQPVLYGGQLGSSWFSLSLQSTRPVLRLWYTEHPTMGEATGPRTLLSSDVHFLRSLSLRDCQFLGSRIRLGESTSSGGYVQTVTMNNNLSDRGEVYFSKWYYSVDTWLTVNMWNNLFRSGSVTLNYDFHSGGANPTWTIRDNVFDSVTVSRSGSGLSYMSHSHNGYINSTAMSGGGTNDIVLGSFTYASPSGGLGLWWFLADSSGTGGA